MEIETFLTHLEAKGFIDGNCHEFLSPSPTRALSQYLDFYLKQIVKEIPSYINTGMLAGNQSLIKKQ